MVALLSSIQWAMVLIGHRPSDNDSFDPEVSARAFGGAALGASDERLARPRKVSSIRGRVGARMREQLGSAAKDIRTLHHLAPRRRGSAEDQSPSTASGGR